MHTKTVKHIPQSVQKIVIEKYGENYLEDADYVSFFWGNIGKDEIKKLFNVVDKALGKSANKLTETDFKKITLDAKEDKEDEDDSIEDEDIEDVDIEVEDAEDEDVEADDEQLDEDESEEHQPKTSHFFLKITLK